jgi:hypothetical protein
MKRFFVVAVLLTALSYVAAAQTKQYLPNLINFSSPPVVVKALYSDPSRLLAGVGQVAANGAVAGNATSAPDVNVESQRWSADLVQAALVEHTSLQPGINIMLYGFKREMPDGSFGKENDFQHISFFMEASARTLILLKQTGDPAYASVIASTTPLLEKAAQQFIADGDADRQNEKGKTFTHRYYLLAAALGETAVITHDAALAARAEEYAKRGLAAQLADGTNPEKDGYDLNYGAASGLFAERYYSICTNQEMRAAIRAMLHKALARESKSVMPNGALSMEDSTRTGKDAKHDNSGKPKGMDHKSIIPFFAIGAVVTGEDQYTQIAQRIAMNRGWWK